MMKIRALQWLGTERSLTKDLIYLFCQKLSLYTILAPASQE